MANVVLPKVGSALISQRDTLCSVFQERLSCVLNSPVTGKQVRCCLVFTPGYNHSKTSLPSHLNLLATAEDYLDQVRTDMALHVSALSWNVININNLIKDLCLHC